MIAMFSPWRCEHLISMLALSSCHVKFCHPVKCVYVIHSRVIAAVGIVRWSYICDLDHFQNDFMNRRQSHDITSRLAKRS